MQMFMFGMRKKLFMVNRLENPRTQSESIRRETGLRLDYVNSAGRKGLPLVNKLEGSSLNCHTKSYKTFFQNII